ncbi:MAG: hypothetical protein HYR60_16900 [Acidobacteria bacterium]|nr:hypothetical protein [Acidobacteriota bacterium]MBI3472797.1 hypothetical protein [Candidatus Solibacter usitatus]
MKRLTTITILALGLLGSSALSLAKPHPGCEPRGQVRVPKRDAARYEAMVQSAHETSIKGKFHFEYEKVENGDFVTFYLYWCQDVLVQPDPGAKGKALPGQAGTDPKAPRVNFPVLRLPDWMK